MKNLLNEKKLNYKDIIILLIIISIYTIISFINLGDNKSISTFQKINTEGIKINLSKEEFITKIKYYNGRITNDFYIIINNKEIISENNSSFSWKELLLKKNIKTLKLIPINNIELGEIALYNNKQEKINTKIIYKNKKIYNLSDENSIIPDKISYLNSTYFDEIYFARSTYEYVNNLSNYEWTHPPLGKLIQAIPIFITKEFTPFNYRLMGNIAGILMILIMYLFAHEMYQKRKYSILGSLLVFFDNAHFVQTRIGTVDSFLVLFILISTYYLYKYIKYLKIKHLIISIIFLSLSTSVKWIGLYLVPAYILILFIINRVQKEKIYKYILKISLLIIIIPLIYISINLIKPNLDTIKTNNIKNIITQTKTMYDYHSNINQDHPFSSKWYTWPISYKPVWYYTKDNINTKQTIAFLGNVSIWYLGIITILLLPYYIIKKKNKKSLFILILILSLYLPNILINRIMFLYHYFPILPFLYLSIINFYYQINKNNKQDKLIYIYIVLVIITFIIYYPISSGLDISKQYVELTKIFNSWIY